MAREERIIYVYDDFSCDEPVLLGKLYIGVIKQGETYSFEYDKGWLTNNKMSISLDPEIQPFVGRQFPNGKNIFGLFADASPDRWGQILLNKRESHFLIAMLSIVNTHSRNHFYIYINHFIYIIFIY